MAYPDAGAFSYGYGHRGVPEGSIITEPVAADLLMEDALATAELIKPRLPEWINPNQFASLISFTYNVGAGRMGYKDGFLVLKDGEPSTLLKEIQASKDPSPNQLYEIGNLFLHWIYANGEPHSGLCSRRTKERALFLKPYANILESKDSRS